jgi:hypothetical protein
LLRFGGSIVLDVKLELMAFFSREDHHSYTACTHHGTGHHP